MTSTHVDLRVNGALGREYLARAVMGPGGWRVEARLDGRSFSKRCGSWQAVERTVHWRRRHVDDQPAAHPWSAIAAATLVMLLSGAALAVAQVPDDLSPAVREFTAATQAYVHLHRQLEGNLPRLQITSDPETIHRAVHAMAAAVRAARSTAQPGDFFTEPLAMELRARVADALARHGFTPADVRAAEAAEGIDSSPLLRVNGPFPWLYATSMFPCVLDALPPLPPELQYRIVGNTLVLIDVHADLIVDLLPYVLAETER